MGNRGSAEAHWNRNSRTTPFLMFRQQRHPTESLAARRTRVLLHITVGLQMRPQIAPVRKRPIAVLTTERLLSSVGSDVTLKKPRPRESFSTKMTLAGQGVCPDVHFECTQADVDLLTELAGEALLRLSLGRGAVELLMFRQTRIGRVGLATVGTRVTRRWRA